MRRLLLVLLVVLMASTTAHAHVIWSIGKFDFSSGEFKNEGIDYKTDPVFIVGRSKDSDWYRFQPGPANAMCGGRTHPFIVRFDLAKPAQTDYRLDVAVLYETPRLSYLQLSVNGHIGNFYFHPRLDFHAGDWEGTFVPQTSCDTTKIAIPAAWLRPGPNELVLTALDDPAAPQKSFGAIAPGHSGITYDALQLTDTPTSSKAPLIEPTIFYRTANVEVVDVYAPAAAGPVTLSMAGQSLTLPGHAADFGEQRLTFDMPAWAGAADATLRVGTVTTTTRVTAAKKWTLAIIPHEHLDVGFTDYAAKVGELHAQSIDAAMHLMQQTPDFRWTLDGSWAALHYLSGRGPEARARFVEHVRAGSVVIPPELANQHTGNASWEGLAHSLYDERALERQYHLPRTDAAQIVDVPSYTWAYASILHDAGIKYLLAASNSWRAPGMLLGQWNEKSPFYWEGPDGSRVLMWYARAYLQMHTLFGSPWTSEAMRDSLPVFLQAYTRPDFTASTAIIFGTQLENTPLAPEQTAVVAAFNRQYAWPRLQFSTVHQAMSQIEKEWRGPLAVYRGDFGPYWEDGYGADARFTALHRDNQHRLLTAEIMGAAASSLEAQVRPDAALLADAWRNELLFDEHTWTFAGATTQPETQQSEQQLALKESRAERAHHDIDESIQRGWAQLEAQLRPAENSIAVFNPLSWSRGGAVEADVPADTGIVDATTGQPVACEVLHRGTGLPLPGFGANSERVRFEARDVPAVGYKLYTLRPGRPAPAAPSSGTLENRYYRVTLDAASGAIRAIYDKTLRRDIVDASSPYRFAQFLYVTGGDDLSRNSLYRYGAGLAPPALTVHAASAGHVVTQDARSAMLESGVTAYSAQHAGVGAPYVVTPTEPPQVRTEIELRDQQIYITCHVHKNRVLTREAAYLAFPFAVRAPRFDYGSQSAWVDPARDELAGGSREWYVPTTWSRVRDAHVAAAVVPLDAPLVCFGDIVRGRWPAHFEPKSSTIFSWLMNNYWGTNFPTWQGGDFTFRYVITSGAALPEPALTRTALEALTPLEHDDVAGSDTPSTLPIPQASLLDVDNPSVTLLTWKRAEDGDGTVLRLQETAGRPQRVRVSSRFVRFEHAWRASAVEDPETELQCEGGAVAVAMRPFETLTLRLQGERR